jgi:hypothetical protein
MEWQEQLRTDLSAAIGKTIDSASEEEALNEALTIADEWRMRLDEIRSEE